MEIKIETINIKKSNVLMCFLIDWISQSVMAFIFIGWVDLPRKKSYYKI